MNTLPSPAIFTHTIYFPLLLLFVWSTLRKSESSSYRSFLREMTVTDRGRFPARFLRSETWLVVQTGLVPPTACQSHSHFPLRDLRWSDLELTLSRRRVHMEEYYWNANAPWRKCDYRYYKRATRTSFCFPRQWTADGNQILTAVFPTTLWYCNWLPLRLKINYISVEGGESCPICLCVSCQRNIL